MENRYLIILGILAVILVAFISLGLYFSDQNNSEINNLTNNITSNNSDLNNIVNNSSNVNTKENIKTNSTSKVNNNKGIKIPKDYKLSYTEAMNYAKKATKHAFKNTDMDVYPKFGGFETVYGKKSWYFEVRDKKTNKWVDGFFIDDNTGEGFI
ncbi:hypothetical protein [Methanobrevibacter curvatus]|uniref:Uncharacterized protein n=1 Tax=Methanobrevibacter curvatus TaxID=49547 RepID=A0A166DIG6_9EURY|nr:hypothetical protein [Methanobrevibacter curvatus]KZX15634.1 hypothetical protein MBCUR_02130 [Methanobrevibacter curvatus]